MYGAAFFGKHYFGAAYWGPKVASVTPDAVPSSGGSGRKRLGSIWPQSFPATKKKAIALAKKIYAEARASIPEAAQAALIPVEAVRSQAPAPSEILPKPADIDFRVLAGNEAILRAMVAEIETQRKVALIDQRKAVADRKRKEEAFIAQLIAATEGLTPRNDEEEFLMHLIGADF